MRSFITTVAAVALCGALSATEAPYAPLAVAQAKQGNDEPGGKGKGRGRQDDDHGGGGGRHRARDHDHHERDDHHHGDRHGHDHRARWSRDWEVDAFVAAGFNLIALHQLLGGDLAPLHVGVQPLPPGIRKKLARGKPLPPGIARKLPPPVLVPVLPRVVGYEWQVVGRDLLLVQLGTLIVAEIIMDALD